MTNRSTQAIAAAFDYMRRPGGFDAMRLELLLIRKGVPEAAALPIVGDLIEVARKAGSIRHVKGFRWQWASEAKDNSGCKTNAASTGDVLQGTQQKAERSYVVQVHESTASDSVSKVVHERREGVPA